jgi:uncharacterized protein involved in exopolysaccharide biosynthesis
MTSFSPVRYVKLIQHRPRFLFVTVAVSTVIAAIVGLVSPYLYTSTSVVQYQNKTAGQMAFRDDGVAFHKATMLVSSLSVLTEVAKTLAKEPLDPYYYFPKTIPLLDFRTRGKLLLRHLRLQDPAPETAMLTKLPLNVLTSLLGRHLKVQADPSLMTISVTYEAGDPEIAQRICDLVSQAFIALNLEQEKDELKRQENYIEDAIADQLSMIKAAEKDLQLIVEDHPSMATTENGDKGGGLSPAAQRYVKKQERLEKIEDELVSNQKLLASIESDLGGSNTVQSEISGNIAAKVTEELSDLEFRRLNSVKFGGYTEDHPSIWSLDKRIQELKQVLANLGNGRGTASKRARQGDIRGLYQQATSLREKNRALKAEKEVLLKSLVEEDSRFRRAVKVNFEFDSIGRNLSSSQAIMNELYRDLQKIRLALSGFSASATVVAPASFSPHSTNLSIQKRIFFAAFVNLALIFSLLLLYEIFRPTLLVVDDLRALRLSHLGQFKLYGRGLQELATCLWSLGDRHATLSSEKRQKRVISLLNFSPGTEFESFAKGLAEAATKDAARVALVLLGEKNGPDEPSGALTVRPMDRADALLQLRKAVSELRPSHDLVLIAETGDLTEPVEALLAQLSEYFLYLTEFGKTDLTPVAHVRQLPELSRSVRHYSAVLEPTAPKSSVSGSWRGPFGRLRAKKAGQAA